MASVRMVSIESCSISVFATELLVETLLSFSRRTICLCPLRSWFEHVAEGRRSRLAARPLERGDRRAAQGGLGDARERDGAGEGVRHDLHPVAVLLEGSARGDDLLDLRQELGNRREAEADALERGLADVG